jgi:hypothetical protein
VREQRRQRSKQGRVKRFRTKGLMGRGKGRKEQEKRKL